MRSDTFLRSLLDRAFDKSYRSNLNRATRDVPLLWLIYVTCIPLAKVCVQLKLSATTISHLSNLLAAFAVAALIWVENPWAFPLLWLAALFFDIADGIVARVTRTATASGSFYDHMSDQVKVIALFLGTGVRYATDEIWILSFATCTAFLFMNLVNQIYALRSLKLAHGIPVARELSAGESSPPTGALRSFLRRHPRLRSIARGAYASVFSMYGNSMLLLLPIGLGDQWALVTLAVFGIVTLHSLAMILVAVGRVNQELSRNAIPWK